MTSSVVQILDRQGRIVGTGMACQPRGLVLTCYHVVADALGIPREGSRRVAGKLRVSVPGSSETMAAEFLLGSPLNQLDLALLQMDPERLDRALVTRPLHDVPLERSMPFRCYGFPAGYDEGVWAYGTLEAALGWNRYQAEVKHLGPGFSGAPVEELQMGRVVGLMSAHDPARSAGFVVTVAQIQEFTDRVEILRPRTSFEQLTEGLLGLPGDPLSGLEHFLEEYLGQPGNPVPFGGRQRELDCLDWWLARKESACALVAAPAGRGKSAFLTRWASQVAVDGRALVALVPISNRFETSRKSAAFSLLGKRLRYLCGGDSGHWPRNAEEWLSEIGYRLREDRSASDKPLLIVLDGLDESADWVAGQDLRFPAGLGRGVRIVVSARLLAGDTGETSWLDRLHWHEEETYCLPLPRLDGAGVREVLERMGNPLAPLAGRVALVDELLRLSDGDPLLVALYVDALRGRGKRRAFLQPEALPSIPPGLEGFIERWMEDQRRQWKAQGSDPDVMEQRAQLLLYAISSAFGPVSKDDIAEVAPDGSELKDGLRIQQAVRIVARFVIGDGKRQGFVFSHPRLREYFASMIPEGVEREAWHRRYAAHGRRTLDALEQNRLRPPDASRYVVQYYRLHLAALQAPGPDYYRLASKHWMQAWYALEGTYNGFLIDVQAAWKCARMEGDLAVEVLCQTCNSSCVSLSGNLLPEFLAQARRHELMSAQQALATVQRMHEPGQRADALIAIAPSLGEGLIEFALDLGRSVPDPLLRLKVTAEIGVLLPRARRERVEDETLAAARALPDGAGRLQIYLCLARRAQPRLLPELLNAVGTLDSYDDRVALLAALSPRLDRGQLRAALDLARRVPWVPQRNRALQSLAADLGRCSLPEGYLAARGIHSPGERGKYLAFLCSKRSSPALAEESLELLARVTRADQRSDGIQVIAAILPAELRLEAIRLAAEITDPVLRAGTLSVLAAAWGAALAARFEAAIEATGWPEHRAAIRLGLARHLHAAAFDEALASSALVRDPAVRIALLADLVEAVDPERRPPVLAEAIRLLWNQMHHTGVAEALPRLVPFFTSADRQALLDRLLSSAGLRDSPHLAALLPHLNAEQVAEVGRALEPIRDELELAELVAALAPVLDGAEAEEALETVARGGDGIRMAQALLGLAPRLPLGAEACASRHLDQVLDPVLRAEALTELALRFRHHWIRDALGAAGNPGCADDCARLVGRLMGLIDDDSVPSALETVRRYARGPEKSRTIKRLIERLPAGLQTGPAGRALQFVLSGVDPAGGGDSGGWGSRHTTVDRELLKTLVVRPWRALGRVFLLDDLGLPASTEVAGEICDDLGKLRESGEWFGEILPFFLARLPANLPPGLLELVLGWVAAMEPDGRPVALAQLAPHLGQGRLTKAVDEFLPPDRTRWTSPEDGAALLQVIADHANHPETQRKVLHNVRVELAPVDDREPRWSGTDCSTFLVRLAPRLRYSPVLGEAVDTAKLIADPEERFNALAAIAEAAPYGWVLSALLDSLAQVGGEERRTSALGRVARLLHEADAVRAYEMARAIQFNDYRLQALLALRPQLPGDLRRACLNEALVAAAQASDAERARAVTLLAKQLPRHSQRELVWLGWTIWGEKLRKSALDTVPVHDKSAPVRAAFEVAEALSIWSGKSVAVACLATHAAEDRRPAAVARVFEAAIAQRDRQAQVECLVPLLFAATGAARDRIVRRLIRTTNGLSDLGRVEVLIQLLENPALQEAERRLFRRMAWEVVGQIDPNQEKLDALQALWPLLGTDEMATAWSWSWSIGDPSLRREVQGKLGSASRPEVDEQAFHNAARIPEPDRRFGALRSLVDLAAETPGWVWDLLLDAIGSMTGDRSIALFSLTSMLPDDSAERALHLAAELWNWPFVVAVFVPAVAPERRPGILSDLLRRSDEEPDERLRAEAIIALSPWLENELAAEALRQVRLILNPEPQLRAMLALSERASGDDKSRLLEEFLQCAARSALPWREERSLRETFRERVAELPDPRGTLLAPGLDRLAAQPRPEALRYLSWLVPAVVSREAEATAVAQAAAEPCSWWR